jgi:hypothetical protein
LEERGLNSSAVNLYYLKFPISTKFYESCKEMEKCGSYNGEKVSRKVSKGVQILDLLD